MFVKPATSGPADARSTADEPSTGVAVFKGEASTVGGSGVKELDGVGTDAAVVGSIWGSGADEGAISTSAGRGVEVGWMNGVSTGVEFTVGISFFHGVHEICLIGVEFSEMAGSLPRATRDG